MASVKCQNCGLINWENEITCKRCGFELSQFAPPSADKPSVWKWYVAYSACLAIMYFLCIVGGLLFLYYEPTGRDMSAEEARIMGAVFAIVGIVLFIPFAAGPFVPRTSGGWTFGLVLICIGLTSACCLPVSIPLLIFWLKPETKAYFGKT